MSPKQFKILLAEDVKDTLQLLQDLIRNRIASVEIAGVATVQEGREAVVQAAMDRKPFDVAILDFRLPEKTGHNPEVDESLCTTIRDEMPETLVIHITSYPDDPNVLRHLRDYHTGSDPRAEVISKLDIHWSETLLKEIKAYLYGSLIQKQIARLFEPEILGSSQYQSREYSQVRLEGSVTHELGALHRDIVTHWDDLDERLQRKIQRIFSVDTTSQPIRISLLPKRGSVDQ